MYQKRSFGGSGRPSSGHVSRPRSGGFRPSSAGSSHGPSRGPSHSYGPARPRFGGSRGGYAGGRGRGAHGGGRSRFHGKRLDVSMFINKSVVVEEKERHFLPEHAFADFPLEDRLKKNIAAKGYTAPTPIQDRAIPHILHGKDVVGIANTGTGKTAAFLIPLINKVLLNPNERVLVVVPTRELAIQINQELKGFAPLMGIFSVCCVGGANISLQIRELKQRNQFVIGTPGRLKDLIDRGFLNLSKTNTVVLDEADRMLDMGFINDMRFLMQKMPPVRHTLFFSATLSRDIEKLIHEFLREPVSISVKTQETAKSVEQDIVRMKAGQEKLDALESLLKQEEFKKVLIFGRTKHGVEKLAISLNKKGFKADSIHGNKSHGQRQRALGQFKDDRIQALVATDVAARGLDIADVTHVINYDVPASYEDYVHRIGRTGRGNKKGKALTFIE